MESLEQILAIMKLGKVFIYTEPEIPDFTKKEKINVVLMGPNSISRIPIKDDMVYEACGFLEECVFSKGMVNIVWNIKNLFSYIRYCGKKLNSESKIYDLAVIESYLGQDNNRPASYEEAMTRIKTAAKYQDKWSSVYNKIYLPLILNVIPSMEVTGIIDKQVRKKLHAHYETNGKNGRLKCPVTLERGFNPHGIKAEQKDILLPVGENKWFMCLDFRSMEVVVLKWLSHDEKLTEILNSENDFYESIFKLLTGKTCEEAKYREFCKSVFLPIVFGLSAKTLSEKFKKTENFARHIINTLESNFPAAFSYVKENQYSGELSDYLGRVRKFEGNSPTLRRNFVIQSPASTVCFEKLISLNAVLKNEAQIGFNVHDGYYVYVRKDKCDYVYNLAKKALETPSEILPGLKLKISCKVGPTLNNLHKME